MKKYSHYVLMIFLFPFLMIGCQKDDLKKPTDVSFKMDINRNLSNQGHLVFDSGTILLADFSVAGERDEGEPVSFTKSFSQGLNVDFNETATIPELIFDIPQGNYYSLVVAFNTFDDNGGNTIVVNGTYTNLSGSSFPLRFEFLSSEYFSIVGEADSGSATIVLDKDISVTSLIKFDPIYWFELVSNSMLDNATLVNVDGQMTILINSNTNSNIYDIIADRIDQATESIWV